MNRHQQSGLTLVELMIAATLGLLVTLAVTSIFVSSRLSYQQNDDIANMQENARFALEMITQDLRHTSFFGNVTDPRDIDTTNYPINAPTANADCGLYNITQATSVFFYGDQITDADVNTALAPCLTNTEVRPTGNSIFALKRVETQPIAVPVDGTTYIYANEKSALLYSAPLTMPFAGGKTWEFQYHIYYVDNNNVLQRKYLTYASGAPALTTEPLADGIEAFHIEFGIDKDHDGTPDEFYTPAALTSTDTTIDDAISATVYVLARTPQADISYKDTKTYQLGSLNLGPFNDQFHRRVYSTTIVMKNRRNQVGL